MPLTFHPPRGTIVICDFSTGFQPPEMIKVRPVVIISPRFRQRENLCTVVPLSTTPPVIVAKYHHRLFSTPYPPAAGGDVWAKCDMLATVSLARLDRVKAFVQAVNRRGAGLNRPDDIFHFEDLAELR